MTEQGLEAVEERLHRFASLVAGSPHNLVSKQARAELVGRHVPESRRFAATLPGPGRLLDLGSGGGFPGMVIAVVRPDLDVHLLEATHKKADFLERTGAALGIPVTVHNGRAEDLARGPLAGGFDVVTARAVAPLERLVVLAAPFLRPGGTLHALKGERWREELDHALPVLPGLGLVAADLPESGPDTSEPSASPLRVVVLQRTPPRE
ncbi:MAG: 16S rRNA (guanine(527)-N(7))-methyltransferase RsmG [Phycisphaerales bacterium]